MKNTASTSPSKTTASANQSAPGLFNVAERLKLFDGRLELDPERKHGACMTVIMPIAP